MSGGIDDIDLTVFPLKRSGGAPDRNTSLFLYSQVIGLRSALVNAPQASNSPALKKKLLSNRGFSCINMSNNS